jgi:hypothetical protein
MRDPVEVEHVSVGVDVVVERRAVLGDVDRQGCVLITNADDERGDTRRLNLLVHGRLVTSGSVQ